MMDGREVRRLAPGDKFSYSFNDGYSVKHLTMTEHLGPGHIGAVNRDTGGYDSFGPEDYDYLDEGWIT